MSADRSIPPGAESIHVIVTGKVQGVGYRAWTVLHAKVLKLNGWVRNLKDGTVEAVLEGPQDVLEQMLEKMRQGPSFSKVQNLQITKQDCQGLDCFSVTS